MIVCKALGWLLVAGALMVGAAELFRSIIAGRWEIYSFGEAWSSIHANSLIGFGSMIENHVSPALWLDVGLPLLNLSLWIVLLAPGLLAVVLCRGRRRGLSSRRRF